MKIGLALLLYNWTKSGSADKEILLLRTTDWFGYGNGQMGNAQMDSQEVRVEVLLTL